MGDSMWWDVSWNPIAGCTKTTEGCRHCYAEKMAARFRSKILKFEHTTTKDGKWNGEIALDANALEKPLNWRRPRRIFVNSMSDTFHHNVPIEAISDIFDVVDLCPQHTFIFLTKRPHIAMYFWDRIRDRRNVWIGTTVESQDTVWRLKHLQVMDGAWFRFVSVEPMLGPVVLGEYAEWLNWCICGCETGFGSRSTRLEWITDLRDECEKVGVPFYLKQYRSENNQLVTSGVLGGKLWRQEILTNS